MLYKIGLTGSIGSGKSTVARMIKDARIYLLDADEIARDLTKKDSPIIMDLVGAFGYGIIDENGVLDRRLLAEIAFSSDDNKKNLSDIVTIKVKEIMDRMVDDYDKEGGRLIVLDVPLLFEYQMNEIMDEVWCVVADKDIRFERANQRDGISRQDFDKRDASQMSQEEKILLSDVVIENNEGLDALFSKVNKELCRIKDLLEI